MGKPSIWMVISLRLGSNWQEMRYMYVSMYQFNQVTEYNPPAATDPQRDPLKSHKAYNLVVPGQ